MLTKDNFPAYKIQSHIESLLHKLSEIHHDHLEPEFQEKLDEAQAILGDICASAERKMKKVMNNYSFLHRDHVFFDGDHEHHSGAV